MALCPELDLAGCEVDAGEVGLGMAAGLIAQMHAGRTAEVEHPQTGTGHTGIGQPEELREADQTVELEERVVLILVGRLVVAPLELVERSRLRRLSHRGRTCGSRAVVDQRHRAARGRAPSAGPCPARGSRRR